MSPKHTHLIIIDTILITVFKKYRKQLVAEKLQISQKSAVADKLKNSQKSAIAIY